MLEPAVVAKKRAGPPRLLLILVVMKELPLKREAVHLPHDVRQLVDKCDLL